ncbi:hypothetical protein CLH62_14275 [Marinobacter guineae]|uniref:Metallo-beta-lactamase domain-containing protein n=1 Tax=Marinobacter guineae TaxID=432303 RepID=A0A2G1VFE3_9GAMM|nr:MBL fold metallo-hydrolase [Marinobacter guineae]PHQ25485.1 hypothetical protein CLH62_14275 [Marinobacter guineae]
MTDQKDACHSASLTLFGPGVGESLCLNLGNGDWFIIDSCLDPKTKKPAAIQFIESLGLDPCEVVKGVVISHWHDDHIRGMADIVSICRLATIFIPSALMKEEFIALAKAYSGHWRQPSEQASGVSELAKVIELLTPRLKAAGKDSSATKPIKLMSDETPLYRKDGVEIVSLSPSSDAILSAMTEFNEEIQKGRSRSRIIPRPQSNLCASALHVNLKGVGIILGADLETHSNQLIGWNAVVNSQTRPDLKAKFVKIPHHGSITGHHDKFWTELTEADPVGFLTTFSRQDLPRTEDLKRLSALTSNLYCTTVPKSVRIPKREREVERQIEQVAKSRRLVYSRTLGQITLTLDENFEFSVDLNEAAMKV